MLYLYLNKYLFDFLFCNYKNTHSKNIPNKSLLSQRYLMKSFISWIFINLDRFSFISGHHNALVQYFMGKKLLVYSGMQYGLTNFSMTIVEFFYILFAPKQFSFFSVCLHQYCKLTFKQQLEVFFFKSRLSVFSYELEKSVIISLIKE